MQKFYTNAEIQVMLNDCKKNSSLARKILKQMPNDNDRAALAAIIKDGVAEDFDKYDSAVCEYFIGLYDLIKSNSSVDFLFKESAENKEYHDFELELEFDVKIRPKLLPGEFEKIIAFMNDYLNGKGHKILRDRVELFGCGGLPVGAPVIQERDIDYKNQSFYLLVYPHFEGKVTWDETGIGQSFWECDGAPDNSEMSLYTGAIQNVICATPGLETALSPVRIVVKWIGKDLDSKVEDAVNQYNSQLSDKWEMERENTVLDPVNAIIEGKDIRSTIFEVAFAKDNLGYDLRTTIGLEMGDTTKRNISSTTDEGLYEFMFDGSDEKLAKFERSIKRLQKKFPDYDFEGKVVEKFDGDKRYLLNVKLKAGKRSANESNTLPAIDVAIRDAFGVPKNVKIINAKTGEGIYDYAAVGLMDIYKKYTKDLIAKFPEYDIKGQYRKTSGDPIYRLTVKLK